MSNPDCLILNWQPVVKVVGMFARQGLTHSTEYP